MTPSLLDATSVANLSARITDKPFPTTRSPARSSARWRYTASVVALALMALTAPAFAQQTGGNGAGGVGGNTSPTDGTATSGTDGSGGGGGGAGITGGNGGNGGDGNGGGAGGATAGADGGAGAGGSGGGGGGGAHGATTFPPSGSVTGGKGGNGGSDNAVTTGGGGGGGGGYGVFVLDTAFSGTSAVTITGGNGGNGGPATGSGGTGGAGGVGVFFSGSGSLINTSAILGGNGGAGAGISAGGNGGAGIVGANLTIVNSGTISGGLSGGGTRADAITFTGGTNTLTLAGTGGLTGGIGLTAAGSTVTFNQATDVTLSNVITGAGGIIQNGTGTLTLTGDNTYSGGTAISVGKLFATSDTALGTGAVTVSNGATLALSGASQVISNAITINGRGVGNLGALQGYYYTGSVVLNGSVTLGSASIITAGGSFTINQTITGNNTDLGLGGYGGHFIVNGDIAIGTGGLAIGADNVQLNHVVSYTGETSIQAGSVTTSIANVFGGNGLLSLWQGSWFSSDQQQSVGGLNGSGYVEVGGSGLTVGAGNITSLYSGVIRSYGASNAGLTKIGTGTFTLRGVNTYTGATTVDGGTLKIGSSGSIAASSMTTVNAGGTLAGNGVVGDTTINGGTLKPGDPAGTLTVQGSLTMTAASTYIVQVSGKSSTWANVTGTATIAGALTITPLARLTATTTYTIIDAGTLTGTFDSASVTNAFARNARLSYVGGDVLLTLDPSLLSPILPGNANDNQRSVAAGIDNALLSGANLSKGFDALFGLSGSNLLNALTQISGETVTGSQQSSFTAANLFMGVMTDAFANGRGDASGALGFAEESDALAYAADGRKRTRTERDAFAMFTKAPPKAYEARWNVWAAGFGGSQTTQGSAAAGSNDSKSSIYGGAVGADYWFSPFTVAGFSMAGGGTNFSVSGGGSGRSDLFQVGGFIRHNVGATYITAAAAYGWQDITTDRTVTLAGFDQLRANFNANSYSGRVEVGHRFATPWIGGLGLTPYAAFQVTAFDLPTYTESVVAGSNNFALTYAGKTSLAPRSELGLRTDKSFAVNDAILTLRGRAAWAHDVNRDRSASATFQSLPGASFIVNGAALAKHTALTSASAELKWMNGWSVAGTFEGEFSDVTKSYAGKGVVRYAW